MYLGRLKYSSEMNKTGLQTDVEALMIAPVLNSKKKYTLVNTCTWESELPVPIAMCHAKSFRVDLWKYCSKLKMIGFD